MKLTKLRLVLDLDIDLHGESIDFLNRCLQDVVKNAVSNGTLTGESAATLEKYHYKVTERRTGWARCKESTLIINSYMDGRCPDCQVKIRKDVKDGVECHNCGHVFYLPPVN
jgi:DNA-directed RNA polymerase subunit RPC12/RpoP